VNRVITTLQWIVIPPIILAMILTLIYFVSLLDTNAPTPAHEEFRNQLGSFLQQFSPALGRFALAIWAFLAPILSLIVIIVILRWFLFSPRYDLSRQLGGLVRDVPSLIAIVVLVTMCVLPLVRADIPQSLGNIALVIIGFYFGVERRNISRRVDDAVDKHKEEPPLPLPEDERT
jgi:hypothetical protein